jgi:hypothetical protein
MPGKPPNPNPNPNKKMIYKVMVFWAFMQTPPTPPAQPGMNRESQPGPRVDVPARPGRAMADTARLANFQPQNPAKNEK